jgi:hypothetical protein
MVSPASRGTRGFVVLLGLLGLMGCRAPGLPAPEVASPGWRLVQGQAVWQPGADAPAIAGDVVLGTHPEGHVFIDFSKGAVPMVVVRCSPVAWQVEAPVLAQERGGRGPPPPRSAWLVLAREWLGLPIPAGWRSEVGVDGVRRFSASRTGERLELHLGL